MPKIKKKVDKKINPCIYIYCEGSETERNYLSGYLSDKYKGNTLIQFVKIPKIKQNTPKSIIERIISDKINDDHLTNDIHWAVYDRESVAKIKDEDHLEALLLAKTNHIRVVLTNVCIEQWFIYHFVYSKAAYTSCTNLLKDSPLKAELKIVGLQHYDKAEPELYDYLKSGVTKARLNAYNINKEVIADSAGGIGADQPYKLNPYTNFYELLDEIDLFLMSESFKKDFNNLKDLLLFFRKEDITQVNTSESRQKVAWENFRSQYEIYLHPKSQFVSHWRGIATTLLDDEDIMLENDIDSFYYSNIK